MAEQAVELAPGESKVVTFEATPHEAKTYQVSVDVLSGSFVAVVAVTEIEEQLASVMPYLEAVAWYNEDTGEWLLYSPDAPSDLLLLTKGQEYHIRVSESCTIIENGIYIPLSKGVNTIIWE